MKTLVFSRNYLMPDFQAMVQPLEEQFNFAHVTDGKSQLSPDTRADFYAALKIRARHPMLSAGLEDEIVARCRYLRNIDRALAGDLTHAAMMALQVAFDREAPELVLAQMTDEYIGHSLAVLAGLHDLPVVQICPSYFPKTMLSMTFCYGEPLVSREPASSEVNAVIDRISQSTFRQDYAVSARYSRGKHAWRMSRHYAKRLIFWTKGRLQNDPLHLHHVILPYLADQTRFVDYPGQGTFHDDWRERIDDLRAKGARVVVYFPLTYHPEGTIDYWVADRRHIDYCDSTLEILRRLTEDPSIAVVVKEHAHVIGTRDIQFYDQLKTIPRLVSVSYDQFSNQILERIDCVLVAAGSVGIEASVRGIPVLSYCDTSFWFEASGARYVDALACPDLPAEVHDMVANYVLPSSDETHDRVAQIMASTIPTRDQPGRVWPLAEPDGLAHLMKTAIAKPPREELRHLSLADQKRPKIATSPG